MNALARILARALITIGAVTMLVAVIVIGLGIYTGTWPLRRLARRDDGAAAKLRALQELAVAIGGTVTALRGARER